MMTVGSVQACAVALLMAIPGISRALEQDESEYSAASRMFAPPVTSNEVQANVDSGLYYGAYRRSHPFDVPAFYDIAPPLGLSYDSLSPGGYAGVGWSIAGFSRIERDLPENATGVERFLLDGEKLVPCSEVTPIDRSPSCATGGTHTTRTESYRRILWDDRTATWTVWDKDGTQTTYVPVSGRSFNGAQIYTVFGVRSTVDANGNEVIFTWESINEEGAVLYPRLVEYSPEHPVRVNLIYGNRPDPVRTAQGVLSRRLEAVEITVDGALFRGYKLQYSTSDATGRSMLTSIEEFGRNSSLQGTDFTGRPKDSPAVFSYSSDATAQKWHPGADLPSVPLILDQHSDPTCPDNGVRPIDLNGDGLVDFLQARQLRDGTPQMNAWLNTGGGFEPAPSGYWTDQNQDPLPAFFRDFCGDQGVRIADLNGDGLQDIVQAFLGDYEESYGAWLNTGRGWRKDARYNIPDNDGPFTLEDLRFTEAWCVDFCAGFSKDHGLRIFDINGDGRADLTRRRSLCANASDIDNPERYVATYFNVAPDSEDAATASVWKEDVNGESYGMDSLPFYSLGGSGVGICYPGYGAGDQGVNFVDLNGDGLTDVLQAAYFFSECNPYLGDCRFGNTSVGVVDAWINTGTEFVSAPGFSVFEEISEPYGSHIPYLVDQARVNGDAGIRVADLNGDGKSDIVQKFRGFIGYNFSDGDEPHTIARAWLSTGTGWVRDDSWANDLPFFSDVAYSGGVDHKEGISSAYWKTAALLLDVNGDGSTDVVQGFDGYVDEDPGPLKAEKFSDDPRMTIRRVWLNRLPHRDLMESATTEVGLREDVTYEPSTTWPNGRSIVVVPTVSSIARAEYPNDEARYVTEYSYEGAAFDPVDRAFNGFSRAVEVLPPITSGNVGDRPYRRIIFRQTIPSRGKVWMISLMDHAGTRLWHQTRLHEESVEGFPYTSVEEQRLTYRYGNSGKAIMHRVGMTYDDYGNLATWTDFGAPTDDPFTGAAAYKYDTARFIVDRIEQKDTYGRNGGELLRRSLYFYDAHGNLRHDYQYAGDDLFVGRHLEYYPNGKLKLFSDELGRQTRYVRDDGYYVSEIRNPLYETDARQREAQKWDTVCGKLQESTDGNNLTTFTEYDDFCRLRHVTNPAGDTKLVRYWKNPSSGLGITTNIDNGLDDDQWKVEELDGFGRLRETKREGPNDTSEEEEIFDVWRQYDGHGRVVAEARPHYCGERSSYKAGPDERLVTRMYYDALGRPTRTVLPDGNERTWSYDGLTTAMTDERGAKARTVTDVWGRVVESAQWIDNAWHSVFFEYDELGQLRNLVDEEGNVVTYGYDLLGRQTYVFHPDTGERNFRYDATGQMFEVENATGEVIRTTHDALGRPLCTETAYGTSSAERHCRFYDWHRDGYCNVGRVTTETFGGNARVVNYDKAGNVVYSLVENGESHLTRWTYDAWSRLRSMTYPDGDTLGTGKDPIEYDDAGRLMGIPGVVDMLEYTAAGRPVRRADASGVDVEYEYTPARGFLERAEITGYGTVLHRLSYAHKENGFVESVSSTEPAHEWIYDYDEAGRLSYVAHLGRDWTYRYTPMGSLTYNGDIGKLYTYPSPGGTRPHAVETIGGDAFSYDDNGNLLNGGGRELVWDASGRLLAVDGSRFGYGAERERFFKSENGVNTFYFEGGVEYSKGKYTKYITAGGAGLVAKRVGATPSWLYTDHLGSVVGVADANGRIEVQAFRPYGQPDLTAEGEQRGFIGQRHDLTGLVYLNDRYYDPGTGQFVSSDRHFARDSAEAQRSPIEAVNAFQYALDNPVNVIDPSGLWALQVGIKASGFGGVGAATELGFAVAYNGDGWRGISIGLYQAGAIVGETDLGWSLHGVGTLTPEANSVSDLDGVSAGGGVGLSAELIGIPVGGGYSVSQAEGTRLLSHTAEAGIDVSASPVSFATSVSGTGTVSASTGGVADALKALVKFFSGDNSSPQNSTGGTRCWAPSPLERKLTGESQGTEWIGGIPDTVRF